AKRHFRFEHEIPLTWMELVERDRHGVVRLLLFVALEQSASHDAEFTLSEILEPATDMRAIEEFLGQTGVSGAQLVAESVDPDKPGFWELIPMLLRASGGDDRVASYLRGRLFSGGWTGSPLP